MKRALHLATTIYPSANSFHITMFVFRVIISVELIVVHGLKKIGINVAEAEKIPNPLHLPETINHSFAISANLVFPLFVILGLLTRIAIIPILAVTFTGYFVLHRHDELLVKDVPFVYSIMYLLIFVLGPGKYSFDFFINKKRPL